ncbi:hypothetical protein DX908_02660 [Parvularcula marina]|uniref:Uncharacterized protein n=2 Tax=Parvularcula marina TaxID=2292771 RepID=A0A371RFQ3_9PROT|nr:hypothetical protein DX908_02660 [Parvularcula marina]
MQLDFPNTEKSNLIRCFEENVSEILDHFRSTKNVEMQLDSKLRAEVRKNLPSETFNPAIELQQAPAYHVQELEVGEPERKLLVSGAASTGLGLFSRGLEKNVIDRSATIINAIPRFFTFSSLSERKYAGLVGDILNLIAAGRRYPEKVSRDEMLRLLSFSWCIESRLEPRHAFGLSKVISSLRDDIISYHKVDIIENSNLVRRELVSPRQRDFFIQREAGTFIKDENLVTLIEQHDSALEILSREKPRDRGARGFSLAYNARKANILAARLVLGLRSPKYHSGEAEFKRRHEQLEEDLNDVCGNQPATYLQKAYYDLARGTAHNENMVSLYKSIYEHMQLIETNTPPEVQLAMRMSIAAEEGVFATSSAVHEFLVKDTRVQMHMINACRFFVSPALRTQLINHYAKNGIWSLADAKWILGSHLETAKI